MDGCRPKSDAFSSPRILSKPYSTSTEEFVEEVCKVDIIASVGPDTSPQPETFLVPADDSCAVAIPIFDEKNASDANVSSVSALKDSVAAVQKTFGEATVELGGAELSSKLTTKMPHIGKEREGEVVIAHARDAAVDIGPSADSMCLGALLRCPSALMAKFSKESPGSPLHDSLSAAASVAAREPLINAKLLDGAPFKLEASVQSLAATLPSSPDLSDWRHCLRVHLCALQCAAEQEGRYRVALQLIGSTQRSCRKQVSALLKQVAPISSRNMFLTCIS
jgi:hypothetical protein